MSSSWRRRIAAPRFMPLLGILIGAVGGLVYWSAAQIWPTSVAVVLSMLATALLSGATRSTDFGAFGWVFAVLLKYNVLMALSAASLPFAVPANLALGLILIAGHAASQALRVSAESHPPAPVSHIDLTLALLIGFAPAALLGMPGLIGLVAAIASRMALIAFVRRKSPFGVREGLGAGRQLTEICFYLGVLAARAYI